MQHSQVVVQPLLPADEQPSEPIQPAMSALDHPTTGAVTGDGLFFPSALGLGYGCALYIRTESPTAQPQQSHSLCPDTVPDACPGPGIGRSATTDSSVGPTSFMSWRFGPIHAHTYGDTVPLSQQATLGPLLASVCGIWASAPHPPSGAFVMAPSIACQSQAMPCSSSYSANPCFHISSKTPAARHRWNRSCTVLGAPNARGKAFPLAAGTQHVEDSIHALAGWLPGPTTFRTRQLRRPVTALSSPTVGRESANHHPRHLQHLASSFLHTEWRKPTPSLIQRPRQNQGCRIGS